MKKNLLIVFCLLSALVHSQNIIDLSDIWQCDNSVFNLNNVIPQMIGDSDPQNYQITFHRNSGELGSGFNSLQNVDSYTLDILPQQSFFARVYDIQTGASSYFRFNLGVRTGSYHHDDVVSCSQYVLEALPSGLNYYTEPAGHGSQLGAGTMITGNTVIYVYGQQQTDNCVTNTSFRLTFVDLGIAQHEDVTSCNKYTFEPLVAGSYYSMPGGPLTLGNVRYNSGTDLTQSSTVYIYLSSADGTCTQETSFNVIINRGQITMGPAATVTACQIDGVPGRGIFNLYRALEGIITGVSEFYSNMPPMEPGVEPERPIADPENYTGPSPAYIRSTFDNCNYIITPVNLVTRRCQGVNLVGTVYLDAAQDGCDSHDYALSGVQLRLDFGNETMYTYTDQNGFYRFDDVPESAASLNVVNTNSQNYYSITLYPWTNGVAGTDLQNDICAYSGDYFTDIVSFVYPGSDLRPGYEVGYTVGAYNMGNILVEGGEISLTYDPTLLTLTNAAGGIVEGSTIRWTYSNLLPERSYSKYVTFVAAIPPTVVSGTVNTVIGTASSSIDDLDYSNNTFTAEQIATNSFDPNDISVNEGETITEAQTGNFLNYMVRFQNTGTANAGRVRVVVVVDDKLDINTFKSIKSSHNYRVIRTGRTLEFIFDNINLAYESADEPGSHGFIAFQIKPNAGISIGDSMSESAAIYFDFNEPIVTNTVTTMVTTVSGTQTVNANVFTMYPNPAKGFVVVTPAALNAPATVIITDVLGKELITTTVAGTNNTIDIASLQSGIYMVTVKTGSGQATQKLVVK